MATASICSMSRPRRPRNAIAISLFPGNRNSSAGGYMRRNTKVLSRPRQTSPPTSQLWFQPFGILTRYDTSIHQYVLSIESCYVAEPQCRAVPHNCLPMCTLTSTTSLRRRNSFGRTRHLSAPCSLSCIMCCGSIPIINIMPSMLHN